MCIGNLQLFVALSLLSIYLVFFFEVHTKCPSSYTTENCLVKISTNQVKQLIHITKSSPQMIRASNRQFPSPPAPQPSQLTGHPALSHTTAPSSALNRSVGVFHAPGGGVARTACGALCWPRGEPLTAGGDPHLAAEELV